MKQIENVEADLIVNEVAKCGRKGLYLYGNPINRAMTNLGFDPHSHATKQTTRCAISDFRWYAEHNFKEWPSLVDRLACENVTLHLTNKEWAKRLAGKTSEEIEKLLDGYQST